MFRSCAAAYRTLALAVSVALAGPACGTARHPPPAASAPPDFGAFARAVEEVRDALRIPGLSIAVVRDGRVVFAQGFGMSDRERQTPAAPETVYPIGSITKTFTATLMLQLAEQGRLDLDAPVAKYVTWEVGPDVRIRHVLSHTSEGMPGSRFAYSSRFNWLDNVVEAATRGSFRELLENGVLRKAGLSQTFPGEGAGGYAEGLAGLARLVSVANDELQGADWIGQALAARWRGEHHRSDVLLGQAIECCASALRSIADADRAAIFGESSDPPIRAIGHDAGRRILAAFPDDANTMFTLGLSLGQVRRDFRVQGTEGAEAVALFERIFALGKPVPDWMEGWSSYLVAESVADRDPSRARTLAERAIATRVDTDGLQRRATELLARLR